MMSLLHLPDRQRSAKVETAAPSCQRVRAAGKFFQLGEHKWFLKGLTYGPFAPNSNGEYLPEPWQAERDLGQIAGLGANCIRVYHTPPEWLLDAALAQNLRVFIDVPWEKHRCFFEDWSSTEDARRRVKETARRTGNHPAIFAISVANEFPNDVVRFYGARRIERFVDELIDIAKQEAPSCPMTFANYPSTEFLQPTRRDFCCFNVYLNDSGTLGKYLDRLQHMAGSTPLILGEFGMDTIRNGPGKQAEALRDHVRRVFNHGLAGSFVFSYTDDWFTGGHQITDWAFGVTDRERTEKPAAGALREMWGRVPNVDRQALPKMSVVVCSYNGAATLEECLRSLMRQEYPDYEVIVVDDGSTDSTPAIAAKFPDIRCIRQENRGLSAARNVGAMAATGEIVAYTDSDCVADEHWLYYLASAMREQKVDAIGGPNVPPPSDAWTAQCVAASPGGPSHVMIDDRRAEHVPGCNMAFHRNKLLALGGFDVQFRQAGDDVDVCWRWLDAGYSIGYAASALVWHHRRNTLRAYLKQQKGYGKSEAMLHLKHPQRFNALGCSQWQGVIYGEGAVGLPVIPPRVYHGQFGSALFQTIYRRNEYSAWAYCTILEWHALAALFVALGALWRPLMAIGAVMWALTLVAAGRAAWNAPLAGGAPWWGRPLVFAMHVLQPVIRSWHRYAYRLRHKRLPAGDVVGREYRAQVKRVSGSSWDLYWSSEQHQGRESVLEQLVRLARAAGWTGDCEGGWHAHDVEFQGDLLHDVTVRTVSEELGWPKRFTRARCTVRTTRLARVLGGVGLVFLLTAALTWNVWGMAASGGALAGLLGAMWASRRRCLRAVTKLVWSAGKVEGLWPVYVHEVEQVRQARRAIQHAADEEWEVRPA